MRHSAVAVLVASLIPFSGSESLAAAARANQGAMSVAAFMVKKPTSGVYSLLAYLAEVDMCAPCPPRVLCKPCIGNHIVLSDTSSAPAARPKGTPNLMVFAEPTDIAKLQSGKRYRFQIEAGTVLRLKTAANLP
jgi:hypothetical protein